MSRPSTTPGADPDESGRPVPFTLHPFEREAAELGLSLSGHLSRMGDEVRIHYGLRGNLASVVVPTPVRAEPLRRDGLWEHTCFELFLAAEETEPYWEVNLAPNGDWNLYRLNGYRRGLTPETDRGALPFTVTPRTDVLELELAFLLPRELLMACRERPLKLGVTAVIEQRGAMLSHWALAHGGSTADFHRREDFLLRITP